MMVDTKYLESVLDRLTSDTIEWKTQKMLSTIFTGETKDGIVTMVSLREVVTMAGMQSAEVSIRRLLPQNELVIEGTISVDSWRKYMELFRRDDMEKKARVEKETREHFDSLLIPDNK